MASFVVLQEILSEQFEVSPENIKETTALDDLGADSLDLIDLAMTLEDVFAREVPDEALATFIHVSDILAFLNH